MPEAAVSRVIEPSLDNERGLDRLPLGDALGAPGGSDPPALPVNPGAARSASSFPVSARRSASGMAEVKSKRSTRARRRAPRAVSRRPAGLSRTEAADHAIGGELPGTPA